ncbi:tRNAHis guanylyltransferase [Tothia fuscella]|uniref:tRNA(His) guanylyltransferase n=1 Tax=Tothia fuscella TaxID=1048955 RepID=A0A9P4P1H6_9PEZI|nr:tRNAHis guanylyltransferase [Tothia fuscella]
MANSKYEYVREFEQAEPLLKNTWIVVRIDGRGFHRLSTKYQFEKPNDKRALDLMNAAGAAVMNELPDLVLAYGISDEYSFVYHKDTTLFERRAAKLTSTIVSTFTSYYVFLWPQYFPDTPLLLGMMPTFDGRAVCYPTIGNLRDYLSWRQVDCHINNTYNTAFWTLILKGGMEAREAEQTLSGTNTGQKNEIMYTNGLNYNNELEIYKKGTVLYRDYELAHPIEGSSEILSSAVASTGTDTIASSLPEELSKTAQEKEKKSKRKAGVKAEHIDIIKDEFWQRRPWILSGRSGRLVGSVTTG